MNYPRYPEYKPSGVEWLGEVPAHWAETRLKNVASIRVSNVDKKAVEGEEAVRLCNYVDVYYHDQITPDLEFMEATATRQQIEKFALKKGDVLITKDSETPDDIAVPSLVASDLGGVVCGYHLALIRPEVSVVDGAYLARELAALGVRDQFHSSANGITRFGLSVGDISCASILVPPLDEQRAISAFLDRETARIDALIEKKRRFIGLLQEKRAALISRAVTRGLDPNVPLKDSGVEWLGQIPAHWVARRLKFLLSLPLQYGANESAELDDPELPRYVRITDIDEEGNLRDETFKSLPVEVAEPYLLEDEDLLLARSGATVGKTFLYQKEWGKAAYAGYLIRARFDKKKMFARFATYVTQSRGYWEWLTASFIQATIQNVSAEKYANFVMPVPPSEEQLNIVAFLDGATARLDALRAQVNAAIDKLKEYRAALIAAAVTGKIDVRAS